MHAHKFVLAARSPYFSEMLSLKEGNPGESMTIHVKDTSYSAFRRVVDFIYLDDMGVVECVQDTKELIEVIKLAKNYRLDDLLKVCEMHFKKLMMSNFDLHSLSSLKRQVGEGAGFIGGSGSEAVGSMSKSCYPANPTGKNVGPGVPLQKGGDLSGIMFLPDGRIVIVGNELYEEILKKSIIINMAESSPRAQSPKKIEDAKAAQTATHGKSENPKKVS